MTSRAVIPLSSLNKVDFEALHKGSIGDALCPKKQEEERDESLKKKNQKNQEKKKQQKQNQSRDQNHHNQNNNQSRNNNKDARDTVSLNDLNARDKECFVFLEKYNGEISPETKWNKSFHDKKKVTFDFDASLRDNRDNEDNETQCDSDSESNDSVFDDNEKGENDEKKSKKLNNRESDTRKTDSREKFSFLNDNLEKNNNKQKKSKKGYKRDNNISLFQREKDPNLSYDPWNWESILSQCYTWIMDKWTEFTVIKLQSKMERIQLQSQKRKEIELGLQKDDGKIAISLQLDSIEQDASQESMMSDDCNRRMKNVLDSITRWKSRVSGKKIIQDSIDSVCNNIILWQECEKKKSLAFLERRKKRNEIANVGIQCLVSILCNCLQYYTQEFKSCESVKIEAYESFKNTFDCEIVKLLKQKNQHESILFDQLKKSYYQLSQNEELCPTDLTAKKWISESILKSLSQNGCDSIDSSNLKWIGKEWIGKKSFSKWECIWQEIKIKYTNILAQKHTKEEILVDEWKHVTNLLLQQTQKQTFELCEQIFLLWKEKQHQNDLNFLRLEKEFQYQSILCKRKMESFESHFSSLHPESLKYYMDTNGLWNEWLESQDKFAIYLSNRYDFENLSIVWEKIQSCFESMNQIFLQE